MMAAWPLSLAFLCPAGLIYDALSILTSHPHPNPSTNMGRTTANMHPDCVRISAHRIVHLAQTLTRPGVVFFVHFVSNNLQYRQKYMTALANTSLADKAHITTLLTLPPSFPSTDQSVLESKSERYPCGSMRNYVFINVRIDALLIYFITSGDRFICLPAREICVYVLKNLHYMKFTRKMICTDTANGISGLRLS